MQNQNHKPLHRSWLGVKFGRTLYSIDREIVVKGYTQFLRDELHKNGLLLNENSFSTVVMTADCAIVHHKIKAMLVENNGKRPLVLLIDDFEKQDVNNLQSHIKTFIEQYFKQDIYIFLTYGHELDEMRIAGSYADASSWCTDFLKHCIMPSEGLDFDPEQERARGDEERQQHQVPYNNNHPIEHPVHPQNGFSQPSQEHPVYPEHDDPVQSQINRTLVSESDESEIYHTPPVSVKETDFLYAEEFVREEPEPVPEEPAVNFDVIMRVLEAVDKEPDSQENMAFNIAGPYLFRRFESPFPLPNENYRLLQLIHVAVRNPPTASEKEAALRILSSIVQSKFLEFSCGLIEQINNDADCLAMLKAVMNIFLSTLDILDDKERMAFGGAWEKFLHLLNICPQNVWDAEQYSKEWFLDAVDKIHGVKRPDKLEKMLTDHGHPPEPPRQEVIQPVRKEQPPPPRPVNTQDSLPFWQLSEGKEPPSDFRHFAEHPVYSDVVNPERPYLRRAIVNGPYTSAEHYLDVQFRLFREDLISPIRDGLTSHRQNGTSRYARRALEDGTVASDIVIFDVDTLCGLQVRANTGENMRYVKLMNMSFVQTAASRHLKYGQVVILSSDGFEVDVHIALIAERNDNDLISNGYLGLMFYDERGLETGKRYVLAEPANYLEGYIHVLRVFKKEARLPLCLRCEEDEAEKKKYEQQRKEASEELESYNETKRVYEQIKNKLVKKTSAREYTDSGEEDYDFPLFSSKSSITNRFRGLIADESARKYLYVKGEKYEVESFEEEYHPKDLDESQRKAMIAALTSELALIQGPPGTGKTFIGVEIVSTILENQGRLGNTGPILLVCYTNAALDQFLEKIIDRIDSDRACSLYHHNGPLAVRLGTKSASSKLERARIMRKEVVSDYGKELAANEDLSHSFSRNICSGAFPRIPWVQLLNYGNFCSSNYASRTKLGSAYRTKKRSQQLLATASYIISQDMSKNIMSYETVSQVMPMRCRNEFGLFGRANTDSRGHPLHPDEVLACWLLDKSMVGATERSMPPMDDDSDSENGFSNKKKTRKVLNEDQEELENLEDILKELDIEARLHTESRKVEDREFNDDLYETTRTWDVLNDGFNNIAKSVKIFGPGTKETFGRGVAPFDAAIASELYDARDAILRARPLTDIEASSVRSVFGLPKQRRWELFAFWCQSMRTRVRETIPVEMAKYKRDCDKVAEARQQLDVAVFKRSLIIGATTTGAAKCRSMLEQVGCSVLVIEEAAEVLEAHTFASFIPSLEHAVFIGDHQQLRPNPAVYELARTYRMDVSLFERLINNGAPYNTLAKQHRMNTEITQHVVRPHFYNNLEDSDNVRDYPDVTGMAKNLFFWSHNCPEATGYDGVSYSNEAEVAMTIGLVDYLLKQFTYSQDEITIIATYSAQVEKLRRAVAAKFGTKADTELPAVSVETVDSYQGRENKIIIVSLVRSGGETIGFLSVANRICVALTRAQHGMYVVGSMHHLSYKSTFWNEIVGTTDRADVIGTSLPIKCQGHGKLQLIEEPDDFARKAPDGGCTEICGADLACHHTCPRRCHPEDDHNTWQCKLPCMKGCKKSGHLCQKMCYEYCENDLCSVVVSVTLPCTHQVNVACHKSGTPKCESRCKKVLPCQHRCNELCGMACTSSCKEDVVVSFGCGHEVVVPCHLSRSGLTCKARCSEELPCGHQCQEQCGDLCTFSCTEKVERTLPCGHTQKVACSQDPSKHPCEFPVQQTLSCTHTVDVPCYAGNDRGKCTKLCRLSLPCGHICGRKCGDCYSAGDHKCFDICGKNKKCGHVCTKQCGEKCDDYNCGANCISGCTHISCGPARAIGQLAFLRSCKDQCVMCLKACDNFCDHRSCNRRCYEVCDVKPCEEGCKRQLRCGHACLGLCGEVCPEMCGSCHKTAYKDLLKKYLSDATVFERLIKIRSCTHMFPVAYLDEVVQKHKEKGKWPRCPTCRVPMHGNLRYYKTIKKHILDSYKITLSYFAKDAARNALVKKDLDKMSKVALDELAILNARGRETKRIQKLTHTWATIFNKITDANKQNEKGTKAFWEDVLNMAKALSAVFSEYLDGPGIPKIIRDLPRFGDFVDGLVPRGQVQNAINDQLEETCTFFTSCLDSRMSGTFVPIMRQKIAKAWFYLTIGNLWLQMKKKNGYDLDVYQAKDLRMAGLQFLNATPDQDCVVAYGRFVKCINEKVLTPQALPPFADSLVLPTF